MSEKPRAGTYVLDGMIQGALPEDPQMLESWVKQAREQGLYFDISTDAGSFSVLADNKPRSSVALKQPNLEQMILDAGDSLLALYDEPQRSRLYSSLRSEEFQPGQAKQVIYTLGVDGSFRSEKRLVDKDTADPLPELSRQGMVKLALMGLTFAALVLFISSFFIDYKSLYRGAKEQLTPLEVGDIVMEFAEVRPLVEIDVSSIDKKNRLIILELKKGGSWEELSGASPQQASTMSWEEFLMAQAWNKKRFRCEIFDYEGKLVEIGELRLTEFSDGVSTQEVILPVHTKSKIKKIRLMVN